MREEGGGGEVLVFSVLFLPSFFPSLAHCSRRSDSGGVTQKDAQIAPSPHAYYSLATLRASFRVAPPLSERLEQAMFPHKLRAWNVLFHGSTYLFLE